MNGPFHDAIEILRGLVEHSSEAMTLVDAQATIVSENESARRLIGWTSGEGRSLLDIVHPDDLERVSTAIGQANAGGASEPDLTYRLRHADGHWVAVRSACYLLVGDRRTLLAVHSVDITDYRHLETRLRHAQKLITLGRLTLAMANDFDQTIASFRLQLVSILHDCMAEPPRFAVRAIQKAIADGTALVSQLRVFAHTAPLFTEHVEVNALLRDVRRLLADQLWLSVTASADRSEVLIDRNGLREALADLLLCFGQAMPPNSVIALATTNIATIAPNRPIGPQPIEYVVIEISNTVGAAPEQEARLFEASIGKPASGPIMLALVILHDVVTYAGGFVEISSNEHAATTVRVFLPLAT